MSNVADEDLALFARGKHPDLWNLLGAHPIHRDGSDGVRFALWAPFARHVAIAGDFNDWEPKSAPMSLVDATGVWSAFVEGAKAGHLYKFEVTGPDGDAVLKADPFARASERPPRTASVITQSSYAWGDADWMERRATTDTLTSPMSIYECHLGSWRHNGSGEPLSYREVAPLLSTYLLDLGFTHIEFMPLAEHPFRGSWGYQSSSYFAPTARFGNPDDLRYLIDHLHRCGIGVIFDWVPGHFPRDDFALARFDGTALYEYDDPRRGESPDWGTYLFDLTKPQVRNFLIANALYWLEEF
ncbi:MAG TPA: alpha-amylase family glycosyl hydrolase, partial [Actinomycetota bacterium]|nr:alpha-amylase family glycosyl hydrolase [Actinomycetota bacterium]